MYQAYYESELGLLEITANDKGITSVIFVDERQEEHTNEMIDQCINELDEYFKGNRKEFTVPLSPEGTAFQKCMGCALYDSLWRKCFIFRYCRESRKYESCTSNRRSNSRNPISIIVPCHRVIGKSGKLVGYAGGLWRKEWLLKHEGILK